MFVIKFGGTSVGSVESLRKIKSILEERVANDDELFVVVSAFGGVTNQLEEILEKAAKDNPAYLEILQRIADRHIETTRELIQSELLKEVLTHVERLLAELKNLITGIQTVQEITQKSSDKVLSFGERLSSLIIHHFLQQTFEEIKLIDPLEIIVVDAGVNGNEVDIIQSTINAKEHLAALKGLAICPGFIASTKSGELTTLGRGGSDYTAALFANFFDSEVLEIWTDVDGLMTANPKLVPTAQVISEMSFEEALELSHFGASVIYPPSIQPAMVKDIPILIKNTFSPEVTGTKISRGYKDQLAIRGISSIPNITLLNLRGAGMVGIPHFSYRLFESLSGEKINVIMITQASSEHTICVGIESKDQAKAERILNASFQNEIAQGKLRKIEAESDLGILALVGNNMKNQVGVSGQMFSTLGRNGVNIRAIAQGASERNISVVISQRDLIKASNVLHERFFADEVQCVNLFLVGVGTVGKALLAQIQKQQTILRENHLIDLQVMAISNSRKMCFGLSNQSIDLDNWEDVLDKGESQSMNSFIDRMQQMNLRNSVFLDVTASADVAGMYADILKKSISIVTPNKIAATASQEDYNLLKQLQRKFKAQFLFETNVCAGLPVISTLVDLVKSGDKIHRIEAVLSGTLNFLFNTYDGTASFASIVRRAKEEGYSEPDPRLDLSGEDVRRKILILARESGYELEMEEIQSESFVPEACMDAADVQEFFERVEKEENHFLEILKSAKAEEKGIRYVAKFEDGNASAGLEFVSDTHPFYHLEGSDNIVLFYTDRYAQQPLVIKGAGAGAEVTASGIFADIMRIASSN